MDGVIIGNSSKATADRNAHRTRTDPQRRDPTADYRLYVMENAVTIRPLRPSLWKTMVLSTAALLCALIYFATAAFHSGPISSATASTAVDSPGPETGSAVAVGGTGQSCEKLDRRANQEASPRIRPQPSPLYVAAVQPGANSANRLILGSLVFGLVAAGQSQHTYR